MELIPIIIYGLFLTFILVYSFVEFHLVLKYIFRNKRKTSISTLNEFPFVTIQLPIYNEEFVVSELLDNISKLNYPKDKFEIQVLDDSTDETIKIIENKLKEIQAKGITIHHIKRPTREGYKAGALAHGLNLAKGEFIAIFDADFNPDPEFLQLTLPYFTDAKIGVVQTKWGHHNKNYSIITRLQAFALDAHFTVEQVGRNASNSFINFNGTAGIWRRKCIETSGGWQSDTLTEDLDLSYRAQLNNWKFIYLKDIVSPAELPVEINGFKAQQLRWSKGAAECAKKHLGSVLRNKSLSFTTKIHAIFHLLNSFLYICILAIAVMSLPVIYIVKNYPEHNYLYNLFIIYYLGLFFITIGYLTSEISLAKNKILGFLEFIFLFPLFLSITMGLSIYNSIGVLEGYFGKKTSFVRTAKFNIKTRKSTWAHNKYASKTLSPIVVLEGLAFGYFVFCLIKIIEMQNYWAYPYFIMLSLGFGFVFLSSIVHLIKSRS
jgi:cellulose synthase/poly-beta-1,6-N-acetylglucosamine synthase-like glycosyltransferase